jgi:hypothetical protein
MMSVVECRVVWLLDAPFVLTWNLSRHCDCPRRFVSVVSFGTPRFICVEDGTSYRRRNACRWGCRHWFVCFMSRVITGSRKVSSCNLLSEKGKFCLSTVLLLYKHKPTMSTSVRLFS